MVKSVIVFLCVVAAAVSCAAQARAGDSFSDEAVEKAINKAVEWLWSQQRADGSWPPYGKRPAPGKSGHYYPVGPSAMAAYALLESGVRAADERMVKALRFLANTETEKTYSLGLRANCWLAASKQDRKYLKLLRKDVAHLIRSTKSGSYSYDSKADGKSSGDHSNSQYE